MPTDDQLKPADRASARLERGPSAPRGPHGRGLRGAMRRAVLRTMGPFTHYQRELDAEIVAALRDQHAQLELALAKIDLLGERHTEQIERLEDLARELIFTAERLRAGLADVSVKANEVGSDTAATARELMAVSDAAHTALARLASMSDVDRVRYGAVASDRMFYAELDELARRYTTTHLPAPSPQEALTRYELRVFSQNGEDGVLAELLRRVGMVNRWFVEFGIETGIEGNCVFLADIMGWSGVFMESNANASEALTRKYSGNPAVRTTRAVVRPDNIEQLFAQADVPAEPDVLSIDVDGNDYWIWQALEAYSPRIVVIEYNAQWPLFGRWVQPYDPERAWIGTDNYGASLGAIRSLGDEKGYRFVHTELSGNNAFFVRADLTAVLPSPEVVPLRAANHFLRGAPHPPHPAPAPSIIDLDAPG